MPAVRSSTKRALVWGKVFQYKLAQKNVLNVARRATSIKTAQTFWPNWLRLKELNRMLTFPPKNFQKWKKIITDNDKVAEYNNFKRRHSTAVQKGILETFWSFPLLKNMTLKIWTLNCQGLNNPPKKHSLFSIIPKFNPAILILQHELEF